MAGPVHAYVCDGWLPRGSHSVALCRNGILAEQKGQVLRAGISDFKFRLCHLIAV